MAWYWKRWWRFALSPSRGGIILDGSGRWKHVWGPLWVKTSPAARLFVDAG